MNLRYKGFTDVRGGDAVTIKGSASMCLPALGRGTLTIEGKFNGYQSPALLPVLQIDLDGNTVDSFCPDDTGVFSHSVTIALDHPAELEIRLQREVFGKVETLFRRIRRKKNKPVEKSEVQLHRIRFNEILIADFQGGMNTFFPDSTIKEMGMGLNVFGFLQHEFGIGESARCSAMAARAADIPFALNLPKFGSDNRAGDTRWQDHYCKDNPFPVNLFHLDPPQMRFVEELHDGYRKDRYNIGYWAWELTHFPDYWLPYMELTDEIWVPSDFIRNAISAKAPVPVFTMPHAIEFDVPAVTRSSFNLPENDFLFLVMYDLNSSQLRKNPAAAITAFKKAFNESDNASLVIKIQNADRNPHAFEILQQQIAGRRKVILINQTLDHSRLKELQQSCDCLVSLHRAEGFGMCLAEYMFLGKPVIATAWSGNLQFMNEKNSCLVNYELVQIGETCGPYRKGEYWAEADTDHATSWMRRVFDDATFRHEIGTRAAKDIREHLSPQKIGKLYETRLKALAHWMQ